MSEPRMDAERWERIQALFHEVSSLPENERRAFLERACSGDAAMIGTVLDMIEEDGRSGSLLDRGIARLASEIVGETGGLSTLPPRFGPYRVRELLGEGGMGVVYLAEREDLASQVAVKVLRDASLSPSRRERFASEQRTLAQLNHPSIARLYDADTLPDGTPWFVMEYVEGVPLTEYCRRRRCSIWVRLQLFRSVCEAVQYAHAHAVIHRDLKPSNILVKTDGTVRLLDFGIAKQLESLDRSMEQTRTALRLMTPAYAAPEQIRGGPTGVVSDVYSLGVILYELLAERPPFDLSDQTPAQAETILVEGEAERPSTAARHHAEPLSRAAWADLDVLCLTAMHKDPERRYRSVEALIRDVDHYLKGEPLEARPESLRYRLGKFVSRNRRTLAAVSVVLGTVIALVAFFTVRLAIARNAALAEAAKTQRIQQFMLNLFQGGDEAAGPADALRVVTLLDRGTREARGLASEPDVQAELYQTLGGIYQKLGRFDQAESLLRSALDQRRSLHGADAPQVAESLVALGLLRVDQAKLEEAERLVREGLAMAQRRLPERHPAVARALASLGLVLSNRGNYDEAARVLEQAERLQSADAAATSDLSGTLTELANVHFYAGRYEASEAINRRVLDMDRRLYGARHPHVADDLINLGAIAFERGRYTDAEASYRRALDIDQGWYGRDHPETASAMTMVGRALVAERRGDEAVAMLRGALGIQERVYGAVHPRVASALNELGNVAIRQGRLDEAETDFRRMGDIYRQVYGDRHQFVALALSNLGTVHLERKQYASAEKAFSAAIARFTESLSAEHMNTGIARIKLGRALLGQRRYADAERQTRTGYEILAKQTDPSVSWLKAAREDLVADYQALHQPEQAERYRKEIATVGK